MEYSDDDNASKGHQPSFAANRRRGTPTSEKRGNNKTNVSAGKRKETANETQRGKARPNTEKNDKDVEINSHNPVENDQQGKDIKQRNGSHHDRIAIVVAGIAIIVAICPHLVSILPSTPEKPLKVRPEDIQKLQKVTKELSERLSVVESTLSDFKQFTDRTDHSAGIHENLKFGTRGRKTESDLSGKINSNNELRFLKDEVQKLKDEVVGKFGYIKNIVEEHKEHQVEVTNLNEKFAERLQVVEDRNVEVSNQMFQHNETLLALNLHVENLASNLNTLHESVENRLLTAESDMLGKLSANNMETQHLKDMVQTLKEGLKTNVTTLEKMLEEHSQSAEKKSTEIMQQVSQQSKTLNSLIVSVDIQDKRVSSLDVIIKIHDTNISSLHDSVVNINSDLRNLTISVESHGSSLRGLNLSLANIGRTLHSLNVSVENLGSDQHSLNGFVENLDSSLRSLNVSVEAHGYNISDLNLFVDSLQTNVKHLTENITGISIETLVLDKRTEHIADNIIDKGSLIVVVMMDTTLLVLLIIYLFASRNTTRRHSGIVESEQQQSSAPYSTAGRILSQVRANPNLERKLCVLSFYEETHPLHMRMTQSVTQTLNQELEEFIIRRHEDILTCPTVSLYFLFVDFNERNVILEDPTLGLGDLRLTTVQAVQKMGGKIVIFYVRDPSSRQLNPTKLYNEDLASVRKQHELSALNRLTRFISAYDQLTDNQKDHLRQIVVQELRSR